jgi:O-succinylbenzoic acid--CoA ligase
VEGLHLNGKYYDEKTLPALAREKGEQSLPDFEKDFWSFISDWFNQDSCLILQTSGSTGIPKKLSIRKEFLRNSAVMTCQFLGIRHGDTALLCLSPSYIAGKMMIVRALTQQLKLWTTPPQIHEILAFTGKANFSAMVPLQIQSILGEAKGEEFLNGIDKLLIGGAPITSALEEKLRALNNEVYATYGMTETVSHIALRRINGKERASSYRVMPGVHISVDGENRLIIHAPHLSEEPVHTNDLAEMTGMNEFKIIGRYDHVINSGGIKFSPEKIEEKISSLITERFMVSSLPDARLGEQLILVVETGGQKKYTPQALASLLRATLPPYECPKKIFFLETFPLLSHGKISRPLIREKVLALIHMPTGASAPPVP